MNIKKTHEKSQRNLKKSNKLQIMVSNGEGVKVYTELENIPMDIGGVKLTLSEYTQQLQAYEDTLYNKYKQVEELEKSLRSDYNSLKNEVYQAIDEGIEEAIDKASENAINKLVKKSHNSGVIV